MSTFQNASLSIHLPYSLINTSLHRVAFLFILCLTISFIFKSNPHVIYLTIQPPTILSILSFIFSSLNYSSFVSLSPSFYIFFYLLSPLHAFILIILSFIHMPLIYHSIRSSAIWLIILNRSSPSLSSYSINPSIPRSSASLVDPFLFFSLPPY